MCVHRSIEGTMWWQPSARVDIFRVVMIGLDVVLYLRMLINGRCG